MRNQTGASTAARLGAASKKGGTIAARLGSASRLPSPAMLVAVIALVAALAGSAVALPGSNSVKSNDIKRDAVEGTDIASGAVKPADLDLIKVDGRDRPDCRPPRRRRPTSAARR